MNYRGTIANPNANGAPVVGIQITGGFIRSELPITGFRFPYYYLSVSAK